MITILNGYKDGWTGINKVYIGRRNKELKLNRSPLANPFSINIDGDRETVIKKFRAWLDKSIEAVEKQDKNLPEVRELARLVRMHLNEEDIHLVCYCAPKDCHGDVIKEYIVKYSRKWNDTFLDKLLKGSYLV